jgi:hypothetical protein
MLLKMASHIAFARTRYLYRYKIFVKPGEVWDLATRIFQLHCKAATPWYYTFGSQEHRKQATHQGALHKPASGDGVWL